MDVYISTPLMIALAVYGTLLAVFFIINAIMILQVRRYAFNGDKTNLAIKIYGIYILIVVAISSIMLLRLDWMDEPLINIF